MTSHYYITITPLRGNNKKIEDFNYSMSRSWHQVLIEASYRTAVVRNITEQVDGLNERYPRTKPLRVASFVGPEDAYFVVVQIDGTDTACSVVFNAVRRIENCGKNVRG